MRLSINPPLSMSQSMLNVCAHNTINCTHVKFECAESDFEPDIPGTQSSLAVYMPPSACTLIKDMQDLANHACIVQAS